MKKPVFIVLFLVIFSLAVSAQKFSLDQDISSSINGRPWDTDHNPDGSELAVTEESSGNVLIFNTSDYSIKQTLDVNSGGANTGGLRAVQYSPDGSQIAVAGAGQDSDRGIYIYDTSSWSLIKEITPSEGKAGGYLDWNDDGSQLAYAFQGVNNLDVAVYDTTDWSRITYLDSGNKASTAIVWLKNSNNLAAGGDNGNVRIWDASNFNKITDLTDGTNIQDLDQANGNLVSGGSSNKVYVYDTSDYSLTQTITDSVNRIFNVEYSEGGEYLAIGSEDDQTYIYQTSDYSQISDSPLTNPSGIVFGISWTSDDSQLATVSDSSGGQIYDTGIIQANNAPSFTSIEPKDGTTSVSANPQLNASVSDGDGELMNVSFYNASDNTKIGSTQTSISDGGTASVTWSGLDTGTNYSFYVNVTDGEDTTKSSTIEFTTEYSPPSVTLDSPNDGATVNIPVNFNFTPACPTGECYEAGLYSNQTIDFNLSHNSTEGILVSDDHDSEGFLTELENGSLAHIFRKSSGVYGSHVDNGGKIVARIYDNSTDSWGSVFTLYDSQYDDRNIHGGTTDNGTTVIFFRRYDNGGGGTLDVNYIYSDDNLNTFSSIESIKTNSVVPLGDMVEVPGKGYFMSFTDSGGDGHLYGRFSEDGRDWSKPEFTIADSTSESYDVNEADFTYVGEGRLIGLIRDDTRDAGDNYLQVTSNDRGDTWSTPSRTNIADEYWLTHPEIEYDQKRDLLIAMGGDRRSENNNGDVSSESLWIYKQNDVSEVFNDATAWTFVDKINRPQTSSSMSFYGYPDMTRYGDDYLTVFTDRDNDIENEDTDFYQVNLNISDGTVKSEWGIIAQSFDIVKDSLNTISYDFSQFDLPTAVDWNSRVIQNDGQSSFADSNNTVTVDNLDTTPPTSSDNWTASGFVDKDSATVELTATDSGGSGVADIYYRVNGGSYTTVAGSSATVTISSQGNNTLEYYAEDSAGNTEATNTEYVAFETTNAPSAGLSKNLSNPKTLETIEFDASGSTDSDGSISSYEWDLNDDGVFDDATGVTATKSYSDNTPSGQTESISVKVTDNDGLTDTSTITFSVDNRQPTASFTKSTTNLKVDVDASGSSDQDGSISSYEWDWTNDGSFDASGQTQSYNYSFGGSYNLKLRVTDDDGATSTVLKTVDVSSDSTSGGGSDTGPTEVAFTLDNVGSSAWVVENDSTGVAGDSENPDINLEQGKRYTIRNNGYGTYGTHPLAFFDSSGNILLSQSSTGSFESDADVNWVDNGDTVSFTVTQELYDALSGYKCTVHGSMEGDIVQESSSSPSTGGGGGGGSSDDDDTLSVTSTGNQSNSTLVSGSLDNLPTELNPGIGLVIILALLVLPAYRLIQ